MFRRNQMEIIIAVLVLGVALWWFFVREDKKSEDVAPYKIETPPVELGRPADDRVETPAPAVTEAPVKAPTRAKVPATAKAPVKAKAPARAKAPAKARAPAKPRATKTKPQA